MSAEEFDLHEFMQKGVVAPPLCERHKHDLLVKKLRVPETGPWRSYYAIASCLLFQGLTAEERYQKRLGKNPDAMTMNIVLGEIGCPACYNMPLYRLVLNVFRRGGFDHAAAVVKDWKLDPDFARWMRA